MCNVHCSEELILKCIFILLFLEPTILVLSRERATAEECLLHSWLAQTDVPETLCWSKNIEEEADALTVNEDDSTSEISVDREKTEESVVTEELIVVASYTLGQCRQSEKDNIVEQKAISKRFKFEEPLLQELPGEFIY